MTPDPVRVVSRAGRTDDRHFRRIRSAACDRDAIISLSSGLEELPQLMIELSMPTYSTNSAGKVLVDKAPDGARSPNLADAAMIAFSPIMSIQEVWGRL